MPSKIKILSPDVANKIAAGEVVQRPASVVKELIENAIDAGASRITIKVKDAGKSLIQIVDNGEGMSELDASLAFKRHSTSKIRSAEDLEGIKTMGFRGEALASIAAVSQVELKTRSIEDELATVIRVEGDVLKEKTKASMERGTCILVRNLFYNTPARRNFLKSNQTELRNITDVVSRMALAFPDVEWKYISEDEILFDLKAETLENRVKNIFGQTQFENLLQIDEVTPVARIFGFISKPNFLRRNRAEQFVFLNKRYIYNKMINHAVFQAYESVIERGMFPFFILFLEMDPRKVDVNVHPTKLEVKFENESDVYKTVLTVTRKSLSSNNLIPAVSLKNQNDNLDIQYRDTLNEKEFGEKLRLTGAPIFPLKPLEHLDENLFISAEKESDKIITSVDLVGKTVDTEEIRKEGMETETATGSKPIWQIHNRYIFAQVKSGLLIIDQHVAHERIIYEKVLSTFENSLPSSQQLLFPETIDLGVRDYELVKELLPHLVVLGFDMRLFGKNTVIIEGIPSDVRAGNERRILQEVLDEYRNNENAGVKDVRDNIAKSFACKAAIKSGDKLSVHEMISLIEHLFLTKMPYVCPHGRPIVIRISLEELDKRFGRT